MDTDFSERQWELLKHLPFQIFAIVAGADGTVDEKEIPLPLKHTGVKGQISGYVATVHIVQQFHNPYNEKIEAVYVFPLPQNAAVNEFIMVIGDRRIRGIIRERKEAAIAELTERLRKDIEVDVDYDALKDIQIVTSDLPQSPR